MSSENKSESPYKPPEWQSARKTKKGDVDFQPQCFLCVLVIIVAVAFSLKARDLAGPGYTSAPNQGAMLVFGIAVLSWPLIGGAIAVAIHFIARLRGALSISINFICWSVSCVIPFLIGMK